MSQWLVFADGRAAGRSATPAARRVDLSLEIVVLEDGDCALVGQAAATTIAGSVPGRTRP